MTEAVRERFEDVEGALQGLREELYSLFELVLEARSGLARLEQASPPPKAKKRSTRRKSRKRRSGRR